MSLSTWGGYASALNALINFGKTVWGWFFPTKTQVDPTGIAAGEKAATRAVETTNASAKASADAARQADATYAQETQHAAVVVDAARRHLDDAASLREQNDAVNSAFDFGPDSNSDAGPRRPL